MEPETLRTHALMPEDQAFADKVGAAYRRALANAEFFPALRKDEITAAVDQEYRHVGAIIDSRRSGTSWEKLNQSLLLLVRSFRKRHMPNNIRIYSNGLFADFGG